MNGQSQTNTQPRLDARAKKRSFRVSLRNEVIADWHRIGGAITLLMWCVDRTTKEDTNAETGIREGSVYGAGYRSDQDVASEIGCHSNTIKSWRKKLVECGYLRVQRGSNGHAYFVLNSCKWPGPDRQPDVDLIDKNRLSEQQKLSITGPVSLMTITKTLKRKSSAKTAPSSKGDFRNPKVQEFLEFWALQYGETYGRKPTLNWGKEIKRLGPVFRQHDPEAVKAAALSYLADHGEWIDGHSLGPFVTQFDKWISKATRGNKPRPIAGAAGGGKFDDLLTV